MKRHDNLNIPSGPEHKCAWVKYQLELCGHSLADIAREAGCTRQSVQKALSQGGHRPERLIAEKLGLQPQQIWPEQYDEFGTPLRQRGRPALKAITTTKDISISKGDEERAA